MTDEDRIQQLSAALRAQAAGLGSGLSPGAPTPAAEREPAIGREPTAGRQPLSAPPRRRGAPARTALPPSAVLLLAVLFGALAGGLAGMISAW